ncbi:hypothetical protein HHK36_013558 [Tetracentron sinense]|uniref:RING-type E3 ubiquitin transferase n=1 Tax=Tetracentron sinense TaxID=13715 RepID=A0A835DEJ0_TETSI|nr:hypothetical protein HHK36_013558 [Tetracentron sinense]
MGAFGILKLFSFWVFLFFLFTFCFRGLEAENGRKTPPPPNNGEGNIGDISKANPSPPPPLSVPVPKSNAAPFKPSIAVIVGVLTTMFSITFLLLLYAKHCKRANDSDGYNGNPNSRAAPSTARKNSGIDRSVIDSLPIFRFGSLRGQKDGLECAVCLNRFEPTEVLRLLPKCKHAFHVECVDTWLDAHSTCPLCRYRVDPEDVLLVEESKLGEENEPEEVSEVMEKSRDSRTRNSIEANPNPNPDPNPVAETIGYRRISGRHSSAGEKASRFLEIIVQRPGETDAHNPEQSSSSRRSLDSVGLKRKNESVTVGCFDRGRKDGLLLTEAMAADRQSFERRFEHRIIVSAGSSTGFPQRWSDFQPSDMLFLRSEMIITDSGRYSMSSGSRPSISSKHHNHYRHQDQRQRQELQKREEVIVGGVEDIDENGWNGRSVINSRSVSEITGLSRFSNRTSNQSHGQEREARAIRRWMAWVSHSDRGVRPKPRASMA